MIGSPTEIDRPSSLVPWLYVAASVFFTINLADTLGLPYANVFEKGLYLLLAGAILATRKLDPWVMLAFALTTVLVFVLGLLTPYPQFSWATLLLSLNQFIIIYVLIGFRPTEADSEAILRTAAFMPMLCVAMGLIGSALGTHPMFGREFATGLMRMQGGLIPAFLSGLAMGGLVASILLAIEWRRLKYLWVVAADFVILVMAGGRGPLAAAMLVAVPAILFNPRINPRDKAVLGLGGIIVAPIALAIAAPFVLKRLLSSNDNGRNLIADYIHSLLDQYPWTGIGFGHQYWSTPREVQIAIGSAAAHNDFLRILVELGYVGGALFFFLLVASCLRATMRGGRFNAIAFAGFLAFLLLMRSDNTLSTPSHFPLLVISLLGGWYSPRNQAKQLEP